MKWQIIHGALSEWMEAETWRAMLVPLFELRTYVSFFSPWGSIFMIEKQSERATDRHMVFQTWEFGSPCSPPNKVSWSF